VVVGIPVAPPEEAGGCIRAGCWNLVAGLRGLDRKAAEEQGIVTVMGKAPIAAKGCSNDTLP